MSQMQGFKKVIELTGSRNMRSMADFSSTARIPLSRTTHKGSVISSIDVMEHGSGGNLQMRTAIRLGNHNYSVASSALSKNRAISNTARVIETTKDLKLKLNNVTKKRKLSRNFHQGGGHLMVD